MEANILVTQPHILIRSLSQTLVSAGRKTSVAFTRMRMSMVRPEAAAIPKRAMKTRSFQESPMAGGAELQVLGGQWKTLRFHLLSQPQPSKGRVLTHANSPQMLSSVGLR